MQCRPLGHDRIAIRAQHALHIGVDSAHGDGTEIAEAGNAE